MPQASDELRARMKERFGDEVDEDGSIKFLEAAGYKLTPRWTWLPKPGVKNYNEMTDLEFECLTFLIDEWDFGGLEVWRNTQRPTRPTPARCCGV